MFDFPAAPLIPLEASDRILVRSVNWLGDAVMTTPALLRLREAYPRSHLALLTHEKLTDLWRQIQHCAADDARVIFRTAADERLLPGRVPNDILSEWAYQEEMSAKLHARDRSSIYGAFHLYRRRVAP